nr:unnamed protein product [Trichobilharzia regenti]
MDLSELHLSELRFKPVANLIKKCSTLERLDLSYNNFGNVGVSLVDTILDEFAFLTYVNLSGNPMDQEACKLIQSILTKNTQLNTLILKDAKINDDGAVAIANGLRMNTRLTKLDLSKNNIMSDGASGLAKALTNSICLKWLSLHWNHIRAQGASEFGNTLEFNTSIQYLDLSWNGFNGKTLEKLGRGLKRNCHLEELNLKYNRIDLKSVIGFADCLYTNKTLKRLLIGLNPLTIAGIHDLVDVIEKSSTCVLEELDLEGLTINENISQQVFRINRRRHFTLKAENCIKWEPRRGKYSKTDPVTFLINYLNRHGMRLLDLYHLLDPQQAGVISSAQFTERMIKSEIPLTPDDLQTLIKYIDPDDTDRITYKLLASRIYFFRISVGEQLRIKAAEFSKHQLDQTRLFVRPEGLSDINRPPKGFPSKMKTSAKNSKKQENSSKPTKTGIFRVSKNAKISNTTQSKKNLEANSLEKRQQNASNSSTKCGKNVKTDVRGNKSTRNPLIKERLNFNSESDSVCGKESSVKSLQLKFTPSNIEEYKHFDKTSCDTTNIKRVQVIPISEVFEKKYF